MRRNKKHPVKSFFRILISVLLVFLALLVLTNVYIRFFSSKFISKELEEYMTDADCVIVLGAGVREDKTPSLILKLRLDKAVDLYNTGLIDKLLFSGDHGRAEYDEVNCMKDYAVNAGVGIQNIYLDHAGFSTYESLYRSKEIFGVRKIIIVTQEYHLYRSVYIARKLGIEAYGVPADYIESPGNIKRELRESFARMKDLFKCIIKPLPKYLGDPISLEDDPSVTYG